MQGQTGQGASTVSLGTAAFAAAGNALEFYNFIIFALFAPQIGAAFFPGTSAGTSLSLALATFGAGFLARPLGGVVLGVLGDVHGRKPAMLASYGLMGLAVIGLALTPSAANIGVAAPVLAITFRLLQGFALGGEVGPSSAFLLESAPLHRRGLWVSLQFSTQWLGTFAAAAMVILLAGRPDWDWRIAFLIGAALVPLGLAARWRLPETLDAGNAGVEVAPLQMWVGLFGLMMVAGGTIQTYLLSNPAVFAGRVMGLPRGPVLAAALLCSLCGALVAPLGGALSDRHGRRRVALAAMAALLLVLWPCFAAMLYWKTPLSLYLATAAMVSLLALGMPAVLTSFCESVPPLFRAGAVGIVYALATAIFGGTTGLVVEWLMDATGWGLAPALYMSAGILVMMAGMAGMDETAPVRLRAGA